MKIKGLRRLGLVLLLGGIVAESILFSKSIGDSYQARYEAKNQIELYDKTRNVFYDLLKDSILPIGAAVAGGAILHYANKKSIKD